MINATWLHTFATLCDTESFTRTAERLNMTQPGVSQHIRKLETQIGHPLISKSGKHFQLTWQGEAVLEFGKHRLEHERTLLDRLNRDDPGSGRCTLACSGSFALLVFPEIVKRLKEAPALSIELVSTPQANIVAGLLEGTLDLGVLNEQPKHLRLEAEYIGKEEMCLILPLRAPTATPDFNHLSQLGFIAHPDGYDYADRLLRQNYPSFYKGLDHLPVRCFVNQIGQIPDPVTAGMGFTVLPRSALDAYPHRANVQVAHLPSPLFQDLWLVSLKDRALPARLTALTDLIRTSARRLSTGPGRRTGNSNGNAAPGTGAADEGNEASS